HVHDLIADILIQLLFFANRSRNTREPPDWSSDVCSPDLAAIASAIRDATGADVRRLAQPLRAELRQVHVGLVEELADDLRDVGRSEERRVGKKYRSRWSSFHQKKENHITITRWTSRLLRG